MFIELIYYHRSVIFILGYLPVYILPIKPDLLFILEFKRPAYRSKSIEIWTTLRW